MSLENIAAGDQDVLVTIKNVIFFGKSELNVQPVFPQLLHHGSSWINVFDVLENGVNAGGLDYVLEIDEIEVFCCINYIQRVSNLVTISMYSKLNFAKHSSDGRLSKRAEFQKVKN